MVGMTREMQAKTRQQKLMQKPGNNQMSSQKAGKIDDGLRVGDFGPNGERIDKTDIKLKIFI